MQTAIIIQARTGSTRLPGKVLLDFYNGKSILSIQIAHLTEYFPELTVVLATSTHLQDDPVAELGEAMGIAIYRGSEADVLDRFLGAAKSVAADAVVRICSDNPFLNMAGLQRLMDFDKTDLDYLSFQMTDGRPVIKSHLGLYAEWIRTTALVKANGLTKEPFYHEHVTNFIYGHHDIFNCKWLPLPFASASENTLRFTLDDSDDFSLQQTIYKALGEETQDVDKLLTFVESEGLLPIMKQQIEKYEK